MNRASPAQLERARRLLAHEGGEDAGSAADCAAAAVRVYDKLHAWLAPLVGSSGVQALFARSARLAHAELASLSNVAILESSTKLREGMLMLAPAVATATAATLFGTFFALMDTFIGERLTIQVLRSAWPTIEVMTPGDTMK